MNQPKTRPGKIIYRSSWRHKRAAGTLYPRMGKCLWCFSTRLITTSFTFVPLRTNGSSLSREYLHLFRGLWVLPRSQRLWARVDYNFVARATISHKRFDNDEVENRFRKWRWGRRASFPAISRNSRNCNDIQDWINRGVEASKWRKPCKRRES